MFLNLIWEKSLRIGPSTRPDHVLWRETYSDVYELIVPWMYDNHLTAFASSSFGMDFQVSQHLQRSK